MRWSMHKFILVILQQSDPGKADESPEILIGDRCFWWSLQDLRMKLTFTWTSPPAASLLSLSCPVNWLSAGVTRANSDSLLLTHCLCSRGLHLGWRGEGERVRTVSISWRLMSTDRLTHSRDNPEQTRLTHYLEPDQQNGVGGGGFILHWKCVFKKKKKNIIREA